jgi:hypothetical protein
MSSAGQPFVANRIPGERVAETINTANSGNVTAEAITDTITIPVVSGRKYKVEFSGSVTGGAAERFLARFRLTNILGTILQTGRFQITVATNYYVSFKAHFTAGSTGNQVVVLTLQRETAVANVVRVGNATQPAETWAEYISG